MTSKTYLVTFSIIMMTFLAGCVTDRGQKKGDELAMQVKAYEDILLGFQQKTLKYGTPIETVRSLYGEPQDSFSSGSKTGSTDIWSYYKIPKSEGEEPAFKPIRLYFNNGKLIDWNY